MLVFSFLFRSCRFQALCEGEDRESGGWSGQGGYLEFSYICNLILTATALRSASDRACMDVLVLCIVLIGYVCVGNTPNQQRLAWGGDRALLGKLSSLPFKFFCDASHKEILFPTLVCAVSGCASNLDVIEKDLNPEILASYLKEKMSSVTEWAERMSKGRGKKREKRGEEEDDGADDLRKDSLLEGDDQDEIDYQTRIDEACELSKRLSMDLWLESIHFLEKRGGEENGTAAPAAADAVDGVD